MNSRILGIDYGSRKVGIAISDALLITAQPFDTIRYKSGEELLKKLQSTLTEKKIDKIVVGIPRTLGDTDSHMTREVTAFVKELKDTLEDVEIVTWDERLTSMQAERVLIEGGVRREKRKDRVDTLAASIMLQSYLDFLNRNQSEKHEIKD